MDAELLLAHVLGMGRLDLYLAFDRPVDDDERGRMRALLRERGRGVPIAYLVGQREFYSLAFHVEPGVLVPRPETEHLVEVALEGLDGNETPVFVDVGCGSGCIGITLLLEMPGARGHAVDCSDVALRVTRENAERHGVLDRLVLHEAGDLLAPVAAVVPPGSLDLVVSNPPYIALDDPSVEEGVRAHEPSDALFVPDGDPLHFVRRLARDAEGLLVTGGLLAIEVGMGAAPGALEVLEARGYQDVRTTPDLAGIDRVVHGRRPTG